MAKNESDIERNIKLNYFGMVRTLHSACCIECKRVEFSMLENRQAAENTFIAYGWIRAGGSWYCQGCKEQAREAMEDNAPVIDEEKEREKMMDRLASRSDPRGE